ncbi:MAG TPA: response regulator transcription factor [Thermomicrobiaceae bacterium]|nr:response regulator transcription factor [Thermomicrobiaceae bacterium]
MHIVVVDPEPVQAKLLGFILQEAGHTVTLVPTGTQALATVPAHETAAVLLDAELPDMTGTDLCKELRARRYSGPMIFVSHRSHRNDKISAFDHGADDYVVEPYDPQELLARVDAVVRRCRHADFHPLGTVLKVGEVELSIGELTVRTDLGREITLTPTEMRILECLMRNSPITISRDTLIERTWGYDFAVEGNRVDVYIMRLRKKLEVDPARPQLLQTVRGIGYVFRG